MRIFRDFDLCPANAKEAFVALGNFDGVHLGHRAIIKKTIELARAAKKPAAVMTFEPHPREFFSPGHAPFHIYPLHHKLALLQSCGLDIVYLARFNKNLAATSAQDFVEKILVGQLNASHVVTGYNFAFGKGRQGNTEFLDRTIAAKGREYTALNAVQDAHGNSMSSSAIRDALAQGDMAKAAAMLGAPYVITGRVQHGDQRGRTIGFPTANIALGHLCRPRYGVYAVRAMLGTQTLTGVANIGIRPTFSAQEPLLEAHLFSASGEFYGKKISIEPVAFIRDEQKLNGLEELKAQILRDCDAAKAILAA